MIGSMDPRRTGPGAGRGAGGAAGLQAPGPWWPVLILALALLAACGVQAGREGAGEAGMPDFEARVVRVPLEGGFWGLVADDGRRFDPGALPRELQQEGLRVRVRAEPLGGVAGIRMWGTPVRVLEISPLP